MNLAISDHCIPDSYVRSYNKLQLWSMALSQLSQDMHPCHYLQNPHDHLLMDHPVSKVV